MAHLIIDHSTSPENDEDELMDLTDSDDQHRLESALGRRWTAEDSSRIIERIDRDVESRGDDALSDYYAHHFLDVIADEDDNILERAIHEYLDFLRTSGELGPDWTGDNIGILTDDIVWEFEKYLQSDMGEEMLDDHDDDGLSTPKRLKTRICNGDTETMCVVCQDLLCKEKTIGTLGCGHEYHIFCIEKWLRQSNLCPICRAESINSYDDPFVID